MSTWFKLVTIIAAFLLFTSADTSVAKMYYIQDCDTPQSIDSILKTDANIFLASKPEGLPLCPETIKNKDKIKKSFGMRKHPIFKRVKAHKGIDFAANKYTPIYSTSYGVVLKVEKKRKGYGNSVVIMSNSYQLRYAHLSVINVREGQVIKKDDIIGLVGSTGTSTGNHLHYEVLINGKHVNPIDYFQL